MEGEVIAVYVLAAGWLTAAAWIAWVLIRRLRKGRAVEGGGQSIDRSLGSSVGGRDWRRWVVVSSGLICLGVAVLLAPVMFSGYSLDFEHLLRHSLYSSLIVLGAFLLVRGRIPEVFGRLGTFDLKTFDAFQYVLARRILSLASSIRKIHTGYLNLHMLGFLAGFIACLLSLLRFAFF